MSDPSSEEARERLLVESLLKLTGEHSVTHHEPLKPVVMQPVESRTFPVRSSTDRLSYVIRRYDDGVHGRNTRTLTRDKLTFVPANAILTVRTILGLLLPDLKHISLPMRAIAFAIRSSILILQAGIALLCPVARPVVESLAPIMRL
ncbi:unnamed protein product [Parnassius apollo]|uniref:(apollo) hypothetical protein n=1 Tax=Parnassius apollo TaxID=110799 RepID=A0A8S3Y5D9_PARAO|nr:unnamed protein product [Parnassius apollo]